MVRGYLDRVCSKVVQPGCKQEFESPASASLIVSSAKSVGVGSSWSNGETLPVVKVPINETASRLCSEDKKFLPRWRNLVDARALGVRIERCAGSSPAWGTNTVKS